jgi:O-antigen ligase
MKPTLGMSVPDFLIRGFAWLVPFTGLSLVVFGPELSHDVILVLMAFSLLHLIWVPERRRIWRQAAVWIPLVAGLLLLIAFTMTAKSAVHVAAVLVFIHLFMVGPLVGLLQRIRTQLTLERIAILAMIGSIGGLVVALVDVYVFGAQRAGLVNNPIHLADTALMVGFVAPIGFWGTSRGRWTFLAGPLLATATVVLTGSRGPLLAAGAMYCVIAVALAVSAYSRQTVLRWLSGIAVVLLFGFVAAGIYAAQSSWLFNIALLDASTSERLIMYEAAYRAFLASPLTGYGLLDYFEAARSQMPAAINFPEYAHLHNDLANFAVAGGVLGLLAYAFFLFAPLMGAASGPHATRLPLLYLGSVTTAGYFVMGMTNAVIGLRWLDIVLAMILAIIAVFRLQDEENPV